MSYPIRGGIEGRERLRLISRVLQSTTAALLDQLALKPGMSCLDVGCGGGDVALELARRVLPGRVLGIDLDPAGLEIARHEALDASVSNVDYVEADIAATEFAAEFDLVYARFLLTHMADPRHVLARLVAAAQPGGLVALEDIDYSGVFCRPENAAFERSVALYSRTARARGGDPDIGINLPHLLAEAGCDNVEAKVVQPAGFQAVGQDHDVKLVMALTMETTADAAVSEGLAAREETDTIVDELHRLAQDGTTFMSFPRIVQAWGRRP
jgi:SAM-dependent methyltransferase